MFLTLTWKNQTWQLHTLTWKNQTWQLHTCLVLVRLWLGGYRSVDANIVLDIRYAHMITKCHHLLKALTFSVISFKYHVNETLCWSGTLPLCLIHVKLLHYSTESARNNFEMILSLFFCYS